MLVLKLRAKACCAVSLMHHQSVEAKELCTQQGTHFLVWSKLRELEERQRHQLVSNAGQRCRLRTLMWDFHRCCMPGAALAHAQKFGAAGKSLLGDGGNSARANPPGAVSPFGRFSAPPQADVSDQVSPLPISQT